MTGQGIEMYLGFKAYVTEGVELSLQRLSEARRWKAVKVCILSGGKPHIALMSR